MNGGPIPDDEHRSAPMALQMLERLDHLSTPHPAGKVALVDFARQGQSDRRGETPTVILDPLQDRSVTAWGPGAREWLLERVAELVKKHDFCASAPRFF